MSEFSKSNFSSQNYDNFRPTYNEPFYKYLLSYHQKVEHQQDSASVVLDVGSGPGTAVFQMLKYFDNTFDKMIGTDTSSVMIDKARAKHDLLKSSSASSTEIQFEISSCMDVSKNVHEKVDMVTAAECAHWFLPFKEFLNEARNVLKPNGTLAIWGYIDPCFIDYPELDAYLLTLDYGADYFGNFWEQPGRGILRNLLEEQKIEQSDGFYDIEVKTFTHDDYRENKDAKFPLIMMKKITIEQFKGYVLTFSAVNKRRNELGDVDQILNRFFEKMFTMVPGLSFDTEVTIMWNTVYKFARKCA